MIKFIHKKHMRESDKNFKLVIYYSVSDIFLGTALLILVVFFMNDYLSHALRPGSYSGTYVNQVYKNQPTVNPLIVP